jgi:uncharacterized protein YecE (DUF72 family)
MERAESLDVSARIRVGTSGWEYDGWRGDFYPADLPKDRWLEFYTRRFDTVELNASFYRLPLAATFRRWAQRVPAPFTFAVKASRYLTHIRRLREPEEPLSRLRERARQLGPHLGPYLYQLPPRWQPNRERFSAFLEAARSDVPQAVEFRDRRWYEPAILELVAASGMALCLHDMTGSATDHRPVGPFVYVRFHGAGARYGGRYPDDALQAWADRMVGWAADGLPVWAYFNNDIGGHAPRDADRLRTEVARRES